MSWATSSPVAAFTTQANATAEVSSPGKLVAKTGSAFADFLLGQLYTSVYAVQIAQADYKRNVEAFYFDDNYKFTPKLTVSAGLRYELTPPWHDTLGNEFIVDLQTNNSPISPFVSGPEPQNLWPFFRRQGTCSDPYQGVNIRWVNSSGGPVSPGPQCANGNFPNSLMQTALRQLGASPGHCLHAEQYMGHPHGLWHVLRP